MALGRRRFGRGHPALDHRQALHVLELRLAGGVPDAGHHHHDAADDDEARQQNGDDRDISLVHHPSQPHGCSRALDSPRPRKCFVRAVKQSGGPARSNVAGARFCRTRAGGTVPPGGRIGVSGAGGALFADGVRPGRPARRAAARGGHRAGDVPPGAPRPGLLPRRRAAVHVDLSDRLERGLRGPRPRTPARRLARRRRAGPAPPTEPRTASSATSSCAIGSTRRWPGCRGTTACSCTATT